jgi:hypothetical protein
MTSLIIWCKSNKLLVYILFFVIILALVVIWYSRIGEESEICGKNTRGLFGLLLFLCIPPIATLAIALIMQKSWLSLFSLLLALAPFGIFIWCVCSGICFNLLLHRVLLSSTYGIICIYSCFVGLKIEKNGFLHDAFRMFRENVVFISVGAAIITFLSERIFETAGTEYGSFIFAFDFLALAVSFTYIAFGYFSKDEYDLSPLAFFISSFLSFSIGFLFSALIIEFWRKLGGMPSHWPFICVWTVFFATICLSLEKNPEIKMQARRLLHRLT